MTGTITFKDELTIDHLTAVTERLKDAIKSWDEVMVDAAAAEKIDTAAVQLLIAAKKECENMGHRMRFRMSGAIKNTIASTGIQL